MPVGTNFDNSTMKTSCSLSSLHQQKDTSNSATSETNKTDVATDAVKPRQCHSLTKQKRGAVESPEASWRRSWGSTASDQNKEFWMALQENYNYIMDNQLIDNCQAANCELSDIANWTLMEFYTQFSDIYSWLNKFQDDITAYKERDDSEPQLHEKYEKNLIRTSGALKLFNQQAVRLRESATSQDVEEIDCRVSHLNSKWESVEAALKPTDTDNGVADTDIDNEIECLSKWLKTMEVSIQEVDLWVNWSKAKIEIKRIEHKRLHQDIEKHGRTVRSVVRRCQQQTGSSAAIAGDAEEDTVDGDTDVAEDRLNAVTDLEQRWYELCLRSHEWQYFIESLAEREPQLEIDYEDVDDESDERMNPHQIESKSMSTNTERESTLSLFANENPKFNRSDRKAPNLGTFYFKHEDTEDSDMEKSLPANVQPIENTSSASDNEWTYQASTNLHQNALEDIATTTDDDENVQRLVFEADELLTANHLSDTSNTVSNKLNRVKMWLERGGAKNNDTSCDASAEEDEDHDDDDHDGDESDHSKEYFGVVCLADDSSEELNESVATTCRQMGQSIAATIGSQNISLDDLGLADQHLVIHASTPKVIMRNKGAVSRVRPLSDFCVSQLSDRICDTSEGLSISESALNQLPLSNKKLNASGAQRVDADKPVNNNSTSSTVEDTTGALFLEDKAGGARRKRLKSKKKSTLRKSGEITTSSITMRPLIRKSGSFSGQGASVAGAAVSGADRHAVSDPSALHRSYGLGRIGAATADTTSTTSGVDSDEDKQAQRPPIFRLDLKTNYCYPNNASLNHPPCSSQKSSLNNGEEQFSSMSEQAWDSFQEKYSSEAYSEAHDSDGARRLQEFGEDYRNYLDSQSDWSCQSAGLGMHQYPPPHLQRKQTQQRHQFSPRQMASAAASTSPMSTSDRRSGTGGTGEVLALSQFELKELRGVVDSCIARGPAALKEFNPKIQGELIERCDINLSQLKRVRRTSSRCSSSSSSSSSSNNLTQKDKDIAEFAPDDTVVADSPGAAEDSAVVTETSLSKTALMALWFELKGRIENIREYRFLDDSIRKLRANYAQLIDSPTHSELPVSSTEDVSMKIDIYSSERSNLDEKKKVLLELNVAVHRFCTEHKEFDTATFCLKSGIAELYRISDDLYTSNNDKLHKLTNLLQLWKVLETRLDQLCGDLRDDEHTLGILDCAFEEGTFDQQMAVSARGVAKLLSETKLQNIPALFANTNIQPLSLSSMMLDGGASTCGGSYSDSGISDEGSEHEPGERERRLAAIRRLVRQLEHIISPDSIANIRMQERLTFAEEELLSLRSRCRLLMSKSGAALDVPESPVRKPPASPNIKTRKANGDPDDNPRPFSWYRRIVRASIPFQLALVALVCLVFLFKPQCCDNMNTYTLSLQPHVHYTRGPPPT